MRNKETILSIFYIYLSFNESITDRKDIGIKRILDNFLDKFTVLSDKAELLIKNFRNVSFLETLLLQFFIFSAVIQTNLFYNFI